jgi:hypothetical protein
MNRLSTLACRLLASLALALPLAALAAPVTYFVPFSGQGNVSAFDASAGSGGWVGSIDQTAPPVVDNPLSLVSVVLFQLDAATQTLTGSFEFSTTDLASTLFGTLSGSYFDADILNTGGQFSVDYTILGGTGLFSAASGFGLSFVDYNPAGTFNNYAEAGLLNFTVPAPGSLALAAAGLLALAVSRRKGQPVNWAA